MVLAEQNDKRAAGNYAARECPRTYRITTSACIEIESSLTHVFDIATGAAHQPRLFHGDGPFSGVTGVESPEGGSLRPGGVRRLQMTDGSVVEEEILQAMRPLRFIVQVRSGLPASLARVVSGIVHDWTFVPYHGTVGVTFETHFHVPSLAAYPVALWLARVHFRRVQEDVLQRIAELAYTMPDETL